MLQYKILFKEQASWRSDLTQFCNKLKDYLPQVQIDYATTSFSILSWDIMIDETPPLPYDRKFILGHLSRNLRDISLTGSFEECIDFVLWFRDFVP